MEHLIMIIIVLIVYFLIIKFFSHRIFGRFCCNIFSRNFYRYKQSILEWGFLIDILNYMSLYFVTFGILNYIDLDLGSLGGIISLILSHVCWCLPIVLVVLGCRYILLYRQKLYTDFEILDENFWYQIYCSKISKINYTFRWRNLWYLLRQNREENISFNISQFTILFMILRKIVYGIAMVILAT